MNPKTQPEVGAKYPFRDCGPKGARDTGFLQNAGYRPWSRADSLLGWVRSLGILNALSTPPRSPPVPTPGRGPVLLAPPGREAHRQGEEEEEEEEGEGEEEEEEEGEEEEEERPEEGGRPG